MALTIVPASRTAQKIAARRPVQDSRTMARTIVPASRMAQKIAARRPVQDSRTMARTIVRTIAPADLTTGTFLVQAAPATLTPALVRMTMLLGPALLIIATFLRKPATLLGTTVVRAHRMIAMLLGTTVVQADRIIATSLRLTTTTFLVRRLRIRQTSSRASTQAHGRRTIVHKSSHKRGPTITVLSSLRR